MLARKRVPQRPAGPLVIVAVMLLSLACGPALAQSPAQQVEDAMQAWQNCSERRLPSFSHIGACAEPLSELYAARDGKSHRWAVGGCSAAFDNNVSTFVEDVVLNTDRSVFGNALPRLQGNRNGSFVGINLHGHLVHLTGISVVPRAADSDWQPRRHPYSPALNATNWTTALIGATVQGSLDLVSWTDIFTFSGPLAPYPAATTFRFEDMTNGSCSPYSAFRLQQPHARTRVYFANTAVGPVEMTETYGVVSMSELSFLGVRSLGAQPAAATQFINYTCLAALPASSVRPSPAARRYPGAVNMTLIGPLRKCGASVWYTLDGSSPRKDWTGGGGAYAYSNSATVSGGMLAAHDAVRLRTAGATGTVTRVHVQAVQLYLLCAVY
jgi:hypothetical protein